MQYMTSNNIFEQLKSDHAKLKSVMDQTEESINRDGKEIDDLFQEFKELFQQHDNVEDKIVYPALRKHEELNKLTLKSYQAHHVAEVGILELRLLPYQSETWGPKFLVIKDSILKHIDDEENILFPKAEKLLDSSEKEALAAQYKDYVE
jgi:hemerythrin-like domain-containing protein